MHAKLLAMAGLALTLAAAPAEAQNCSGGPFAGAFLGSTLGLGHSDISITSPDDPKLNPHNNTFGIGGHAGYNIQCGNIVVGGEGDLSLLDMTTKATWTDPNLVHLTDKIETLATLRGKLGVTVMPDTLLYLTAGLAFAEVSHRLSLPGPGFGNFVQIDKGWATGFVYGGGVEFLRHGNWLFRAEVLWVDLGSETHRYDASTACGAVCTDTAKWDDSFLLARLGVSYKFGPDPVAYTPMK